MTVRVVIADDSPIFREVLHETLEADPDLTVVGEAPDGRTAVRLAEERAAELVVLDLQMPGMDGLEVIEELMARRPVPIVVLTSLPAGPGSGLVFEATRRGALDVIEKRAVDGGDGGARLRAQLRGLAAVRVVRRPRGGAPAAPKEPARGVEDGPPAERRVVGIGASAGGPPAVAAVLAGLPAGFKGCVAVVQHLSAGFDRSYASFLRSATALHVELVQGVAPIRPGTVLLAPDGYHLVARRDAFELSEAPPDGGHRPSVDALLSSLASAHGARAVGVVLSGMGADGARGAAALEAAGGLVIAQDEQTSGVFGMPRAAVEATTQARVLPLPAIAQALVRAVGTLGAS